MWPEMTGSADIVANISRAESPSTEITSPSSGTPCRVHWTSHCVSNWRRRACARGSAHTAVSLRSARVGAPRRLPNEDRRREEGEEDEPARAEEGPLDAERLRRVPADLRPGDVLRHDG